MSSLGEKIGEGVFADVHGWGPGQVVKLFKPCFAQSETLSPPIPARTTPLV